MQRLSILVRHLLPQCTLTLKWTASHAQSPESYFESVSTAGSEACARWEARLIAAKAELTRIDAALLAPDLDETTRKRLGEERAKADEQFLFCTGQGTLSCIRTVKFLIQDTHVIFRR
jgi:hypothetical protein